MATYDPRPHQLETDDSRQVDHHLVEGATGDVRVGGHDVSKPSVNVVSWSAVRIGPMIIVAPQRGHVQVARVGTSVATAGGAADGRDLLRSVLASATRAARQVLARKPRLANPHEAPGQDVLDKAAQKLQGGERHRAGLLAMGVILPLKGDVLTIEGGFAYTTQSVWKSASMKASQRAGSRRGSEPPLRSS